MSIVRYFLLISLLTTSAFSIATQNMRSLNKEYRVFWDDLTLIKKCYFSKSPACTENERKKARWAMARVVGEGLALAVTITAVGVGAYYFFGEKYIGIENDLTRAIHTAIPRAKKVTIDDDGKKINIYFSTKKEKDLGLNNEEIEEMLQKLPNTVTDIALWYKTESHQSGIYGYQYRVQEENRELLKQQRTDKFKNIISNYFSNISSFQYFNKEVSFRVEDELKFEKKLKLEQELQKEFQKIDPDINRVYIWSR